MGVDFEYDYCARTEGFLASASKTVVKSAHLEVDQDAVQIARTMSALKNTAAMWESCDASGPTKRAFVLNSHENYYYDQRSKER
jgi:hypothetical protein